MDPRNMQSTPRDKMSANLVTPRNKTIERIAGMNLDGASDHGTSSRRGGSAPGSQGGSQAGSRIGSPSRSPAGGSASGSGPGPFRRGMGVDPARDPNRREFTDAERLGKLVDLPAEAFRVQGTLHTDFPVRKGYNSDGKAVKVQVNIFPVKEWPRNDIYQYDVAVSPNPTDSAALVAKVWNSETSRAARQSQGGLWVFDGRKLAWSSQRIPRNELRVTVDLNSGSGRPSRQGDVCYLIIKQAAIIRMEYLKAYLENRASWDTQVLECMNFWNHCLRQRAVDNADRVVTIRRNFYPRPNRQFPVDSMVEVMKGTYSAFRIGETIKRGGTGLGINVDIANTAFWVANDFERLVLDYIRKSLPQENNVDLRRLESLLRPVEYTTQTGQRTWVMSEAFKCLRGLSKVKITVSIRGRRDSDRQYSIKKYPFDPSFGRDGVNAVTYKFSWRQPGDTGPPRIISLFDYYRERYGVVLHHPLLPVIETTRGGCFPMELCRVPGYQRYGFKLDPSQTASMIKIAVTRPDNRLNDIKQGMRGLEWAEDPYLRAYGVKISDQMLITDARILPNPQVQYANDKVNPGDRGRWDLRGKKFLEPNPKELRSWAFVVCGNAVQKQEIENFAATFTRVYRNHGGRIGNAPHITQYGFNMNHGEMCHKAYLETGNKFHQTPQIIFYVVNSKNQLVYDRIKKSMDCRFAVVSQVLQNSHVQKCQEQYCSNVAMKVNCKLGGATCKVASPPNVVPFFNRPTMMIGLDVSHAAPGSRKPSMAALTVSMDKYATKWAAGCQVNGVRVEIANGSALSTCWKPLLIKWCQLHNNTTPQHIYFFRDGVDEGQFSQVIDKEVWAFKKIFQDAMPGKQVPRFTTIVATKRHHIRFFPKPGDMQAADRNNNPKPGLLVERDATHPFHFDFFLSSHVAIQGTARPVHYHVIQDEAGVQPAELQKMIYQQCYQYARSTTPVSLHPAIYYAHLASQRARSHEDVAASDRIAGVPKGGFPIGKGSHDNYSDDSHDFEPPDLVPMGQSPDARAESREHINTTMWYI